MRKASTREWLQRLQSAGEHEQLRLRIARRDTDGISIAALIAETGLTAEALLRRAAPLLSTTAIEDCNLGGGSDAHWISKDAVESSERTVLLALSNCAALSKAELRSKAGLTTSVLGLVLERLRASGKLEISGESVRLKGREAEMPETKRRQLQAIEQIYANAGLLTPSLREVASLISVAPPAMREFITLLLRAKRVVRMGSDDAFVHTDALEALYAQMRQHRGESFDVSRFKSFTGLTRKYAIPLLEHLDQARVTRNDGGIRIVL
jgi:selenocysteine-specific elongation factor